jgi:GNAT superfamily N-acetyltransferase
MLSFNVEEQTTWRFENEISRFSLHYYKDDLETVYLFSLFVEEKYRNQGLGSAILEYVESFAKERKFKHILLKVERGTWQEKWYESKGYCFKTEEEIFNWLEKKI